MTYWRYLTALLRHKWYVLIAGRQTGVPLWRLLTHDWSKFLPVEFLSYARHFYGGHRPNSSAQMHAKAAFDIGWLHHQNHNPHHWQYWILVYDNDPEKMLCLTMPETYVREMVADWMGASKAYTGSWDMAEWLAENGPKMLLSRGTQVLVDCILVEVGYRPVAGMAWGFVLEST